jgi:hypothetical protein
VARNKTDIPRARTSRAWPLVAAAAAVFCLLAALPVVLPVLHLQVQAAAAKTSHGVTLLPAPPIPRPVSLPPVAQPIDPGAQPASLPPPTGPGKPPPSALKTAASGLCCMTRLTFTSLR